MVIVLTTSSSTGTRLFHQSGGNQRHDVQGGGDDAGVAHRGPLVHLLALRAQDLLR